MSPRWPAVADLGDVPALTAGFRPCQPDVFPTAVDPALRDWTPVTPDTCGLDSDPVAHVLWLAGLLDEAIGQLDAGQRAELAQYGIGGGKPDLKAVA